jgi:hypothetical protein
MKFFLLHGKYIGIEIYYVPNCSISLSSQRFVRKELNIGYLMSMASKMT